MPADSLVADLNSALSNVPLIDPHSHIDPLAPVSKSLDDILGYHYYTELAHSAGMSQAPLGEGRVAARARPRDPRAHGPLRQHGPVRWFLDIARTFLGFTGDRVTAADADTLFDAAEKTFAQPDWEKQVFAQDEAREDLPDQRVRRPARRLRHDGLRPVPADRHLVFHLDKPETRRRLAKATGVEVGDAATLAEGAREAVRALHPQGGEGVRHLAAAGLPPGAVRRRALLRADAVPRLPRPRARASSGCSPSTAASSGCRST